MRVSTLAFIGTVWSSAFWSACGNDGSGETGGLWSGSWSGVHMDWLAFVSDWQIETGEVGSSWKNWWHDKWRSEVWELNKSGLSNGTVLFVGWAELGDLSEESTVNWSSVVSTVFVVVLEVLDAIAVRS